MNNSPFTRNKGVIADNKLRIARGNLLLTVIFTVINIVLTAANAGIYLLFSASVPHIIAEMGAMAVWYPEEFAEMGFEVTDPKTLMIVCVAIGLILTVPYFLCWVFSKKHYGWMIAALVMFSFDTLFLLFFFDKSMILDLLFHAWVLYYLIMGVVNGACARKAHAAEAGQPVGEEAYIVREPGAQPADDMTAGENAADAMAVEPAAEPDTQPLRSAAMSTANGEKVKVHAEVTVNGHLVQYRLVGKQQEELVVDGYVYAEMPRPRVKENFMTARVNGIVYEAGVTQSRNVITVNGEVAVVNTRWI